MREPGTAHLERAVTAFCESLQECTRERVPIDWAGTQNNLANALQVLGERASGTTRLEQAVAAYRAALEVFEVVEATHYVGIAKRNLARALRLIEERRQSRDQEAS